MALATIDNATIAYDSLGKGQAIVLIHGFAENRLRNWKITGWYDFFTGNNRRVVAPDLRGHGESQKFLRPSAYTVDLLSLDIVGLLDHLEIAEADLMGFSMGAWLSVYILAHYPMRFRSVILCGIGENLLKRGRLARPAPALKETYEMSESGSNTRYFTRDLRALAAFSRGFSSMGMPPLEQLSAPVLVIGGESDNVVGSPMCFVRKIQNATVKIISGTDHTSLLAEETLKKSVLDFLNLYSR
ncbi:MAG: alpha/beta hydrolase [Desulfobacterales bacterium]